MTKRLCQGDCGKLRALDWFVGERGKICRICRKARAKASARVRHLGTTYDITPAEYDELAKDGCAICGGERPYNLHVDHDHELAKRFGVRASVRGALCKRDNKLLRDVQDDITILENAIRYLRNPPAKKVLFP